MGTLVDNGGCYFNGEIILPQPEVMAMKDELADLRAFKATTTPAATTGAAHPGKRARVQQDTLPATARCFYDFQFRGEGERCGEGIVNAENLRAQAAKLKSDAEDIPKSKHKKAFMAGFAANDPDE